jgi:RimJ/RimL family protein N-acetyltransferase
MRVLETERILLRPVEENDLLELLDLQWDRDVVKFMKFKPLSYENQKKWFQSLGKDNIAFTILEKSANPVKLIGLCGLNNIDHINQRASWGMKLKSDIQSKGIGFEASIVLINYAFHYLNLIKIYADFIEENVASVKLTKKIGLRQEGLLINHLYHLGEFKNIVLVGILKNEFYNSNREALNSLRLL